MYISLYIYREIYIYVYIYMYVCIYIYIYIRDRGSAPKRGRHSTISSTCCTPSASVHWQPGGLTIHTNKWFLGTGFLGAPPISLT